MGLLLLRVVMSKCGFCGEDCPPLSSHIQPSQCISAYKLKVHQLERIISDLKAELYKLKEGKDEGA